MLCFVLCHAVGLSIVRRGPGKGCPRTRRGVIERPQRRWRRVGPHSGNAPTLGRALVSTSSRTRTSEPPRISAPTPRTDVPGLPTTRSSPYERDGRHTRAGRQVDLRYLPHYSSLSGVQFRNRAFSTACLAAQRPIPTTGKIIRDARPTFS